MQNEYQMGNHELQNVACEGSVSPSRGRTLRTICVQATLPGSTGRQLLDHEKDLLRGTSERQSQV